MNKRPREDELPPFDQWRAFALVDDDGPEFGPFAAQTDIPHHREVVCRLNGVPAAFIAAMEKLDAKADAEAVAGAVFAAYREAAIDAAACHPSAPHRPAAMAEARASIEKLEDARAALIALREVEEAEYGPDRLAALVKRRGGVVIPHSGLDISSPLEAIDARLAAARSNVESLDGRGKGRITRLRLFAERLAPIYRAATGQPVTGKVIVSAYGETLEPTGFSAFLIAAAELVTGTVPARQLVESVAKAISEN